MNMVNEGVLPPCELDDRDELREEREIAQRRETLADIVAEMRREVGDGKDTYCGIRVIRRMEDARVMQFCDRIDAAWKRQEQCYLDQIRDAVNMIGYERFVKEHPLVGNAAAMREALVQCELFLGNVSRHGHPTLNPGDKCTACDGVDELRGMVVRALSAPARNCDLYATYAEAAEAHKEYATAYIMRASNKFDFPMEFDEWLFAQAAERKGDGDGR